MFTQYTTLASIFITLSTLCGVALHESKLDKLTSAAIGYSNTAAAHDTQLRSDGHPHVERVSMNKAYGQKMPANRDRYSEMKRHMLQQNVPKGHHAFDNYLLPIVA